MENAKLDLLRYRNASGLLDITYQFIKQNFTQHFKSLLIFVFPIIFFGILFVYFTYSISTLTHSISHGNISIITNLLTLVFIAFVIAIMCAISFKYVQLYVKSDSISNLTFKNIWKESKTHLKWIIGYSFFLVFYFFFMSVFIPGVLGFNQEVFNPIFLIIGIPTLLLFICSIIFYFYSIPLKMEETQLGYFKLYKKCFHLLKNNWLTTIGFMLIFNVLLGIFMVFALLPTIIADTFHLIIEINSTLDLLIKTLANVLSLILVFFSVQLFFYCHSHIILQLIRQANRQQFKKPNRFNRQRFKL